MWFTCYQFSIHAPREGGDRAESYLSCPSAISIHAPREGGDINEATTVYTDSVFQSTPPARGATVKVVPIPALCVISIHAPREGGDVKNYNVDVCANNEISIHAPREGGDTECLPPTISGLISIHAPREGGDKSKP